MKIAISVSGGTMESPVDTRFGRAKNFMLYDSDTKEYSVHSNSQNLSAAQGAGIQSAQNVAELDADCVITGHCGPKAFRVLSEAEVSIFLGVSGTVRENIDKCLNGELEAADSADVKGRWM